MISLHTNNTPHRVIISCQLFSFKSQTARQPHFPAVRATPPVFVDDCVSPFFNMASPQIPFLTAKEVRNRFIQFFTDKHKHSFVKSSSVVPHDDPTLLFANAGMNQFKPIFLGTADPNSDLAHLKRAVNTQKCIRAGGKHNDLDDVGKDVYHHTFFEMLGNWSFGDFFKKEICQWSWDLLTKEFKIPADRLYVTYFGGNAEAGLQPDDECKNIWINQVGVSADHVIPGSMKDNFWEMGETGPCGPCSEIHYDRIGGRNASSLVNMDDPDVLEIWNLVFIQFNREPDSSLRKLPKQHVDTGMGFERLTSVIQNKRSNYDTDIFTPIFDAITKLTNAPPYSGKVGAEDADKVDMAYRVIADHARTLTIALADGGRPDNVGRGYVLRRILRRAVRYAKEKLNAKEGQFAQLVPVVVETLGETFPEVKRDASSIIKIINDEEVQFLKTLTRGRQLFERSIEKLKDSTVLPGDVAWRLYDTYGFPVDLTHLMAEERGLSIDMAGYEVAKAAAQLLSQGKSNIKGSGALLDVHAIEQLKSELNIKATDDSYKYIYSAADVAGGDVKYTFPSITGKLVAIRQNGAFVQQVASDSEAGLIFDRTNFYAEAGGQVADIGFLTCESSGDDHSEFEVRDVRCQGGFVVHVGLLAAGSIKVGTSFNMQVDDQHRKLAMNNHTGTHVLNYALRKILQTEADQRGSLVAPDRLRFDFANEKALTGTQVKQVEEASRELITRDLVVYSKDTKLADAKSINGLRAVFGETYPDPVTVVSIGVSIEDLLANPTGDAALNTSVELCGGTHVKRSSHIGDFVISSEEAIAKGVRRVIAITGPDATVAIEKGKSLESKVTELTDAVATATNQLVKKLNTLVTEVTQELASITISYWLKDELRKKLGSLKEKLVAIEKTAEAAAADELAKKLEETHLNAKIIVEKVNAGSNNNSLTNVIKKLRKTMAETSVLLISADEKKIIALASVSNSSITAGLKANEWIAQVNTVISGKGGGKADMAQGSGTKVTAIDEAITIANDYAKSKLA